MDLRKPSMLRPGTFSTVLLLVALCSGPAHAGEETRVFEFGGAVQAWSWDTTGLTKLGEDVTAETLPGEMTDPARLSLYDAAGSLTNVVRNYRPAEFQLLNDWKAETAMKLVRLNLAGEAPDPGDRPDWGEVLVVTGIGDPPLEPLFDSVGTHWFAQTAWDAALAANAPRWWCDAQADAVGKDLAGAFTDRVAYTFDDSAIQPDGTVTLWFQGLVTEDLAGVLAGTAPYGLLEGAMRVPAYLDDDGDGYLAGPWAGDDCDDDPSDDPAVCDTCGCGVAACAPCARCINPGGIEFPDDGIDSNCNGQAYPAVANSIAASYGHGSLVGSGVCNQALLFLVPVGAILFLGLTRRRK